MRKTYLILLILAFFACNNSKPAQKPFVSSPPPKPGWKTINLHDFVIDVPDYFTLKFEKGIDSQPGSLKGKDFDLSFDYGWYCDTLVMSEQEYIRRGWWKEEAIIRFVNSTLHPNIDDRKTQLTQIRPCNKSDSAFARGCDFIAACTYKKDKFKLPIFIPQEVKNHIVKLDTIQRHYRRLIMPKKGLKGITGIYMRKQEAHMFSGISANAIVMDAHNLSEAQQALAKEIFLTLRPKVKSK
ncbi:hypothetical protein [Mucilaginibacter sp. OK283]|uniref:hypothetical protein n=1 Tax=Mucilaginibacter sp. OK283 TaxID=1881049 RepID=UPI0008C89AFA|nr:hypothetical protein [Mucilaginibacter sp. OK283]SEO59301.1 hypothetical protein SAMN05428947_10356 [Mucilaginibacter sp. OK283]